MPKAKIYHVRLKPHEARAALRLATASDWSFNRAAKNLMKEGAKTHPGLRRKS